jgi:ADP-ribosylglycohydrolase/PEP-CTERM motif
MRRRIGLALLSLLVLCGTAAADRILLADDYRDKLHGMWIGELLGNYAGRPYEKWVKRGGLTETIDWSFAGTTDPWDGDDDTCFEYVYALVLSANANPTSVDATTAWATHIKNPSFYWANKQARYLIGHGVGAPASGSHNWNQSWWAIDSQITTESIGAVAPGMRQRAADLTDVFASVTNDGFAVHAAQFYAAMYASAAFESDMASIVAEGLEVVPTSSRLYGILKDVQAWHAANPADWRATQTLMYDKYGPASTDGKYRGWIDSAINAGAAVIGLLYGDGDFQESVEIGVLCGFDADCGPATIGGLIGLVEGYSGIPSSLTGSASDIYEASLKHPDWLAAIDRTRDINAPGGIVDDWVAAVEAQIITMGGSIVDEPGGRTYYLPDADIILPLLEMPDPTGPAGLVGMVNALGGTVTVSALVENFVAGVSAQNLYSIIDGIVDPSYNGVMPYTSDDGQAKTDEDFYQLNFDRDVLFSSLIFHEGNEVADRRFDPRSFNTWGGYFDTLFVDVFSGGLWTTVGDFTSLLTRYEQYEAIELLFAPIIGNAIRIRGLAGGRSQFTTIMELEAYGQLLAPSQAIPEPATIWMMLAGAATLIACRRRRRS